MAARKTLSDITSTLNKTQAKNIYRTLNLFSKNLVDVIMKDDRYESVYPFFGIAGSVRDIDTLKPNIHSALIAEMHAFEARYHKSDQHQPLVFDCYPDSIDEAAVACDIPSRFLDGVKEFNLKATAFVLDVCLKKHAALNGQKKTPH